MYLNFLRFIAGLNTALLSRRIRTFSIIVLLITAALVFGNFRLIFSETSGPGTISLFFGGIGIFLLIAVASSGARMDHWLEKIAAMAAEEAERQEAK
jgi:hypothetical protein